jgi:hypothetical protein
MTGELNQGVQATPKINQLIKKILPWVLGLIVIVVLVFAGSKLFGKSNFEILSAPGSQNVVIYLPKEAVNQKNIDRIIDLSKKDLETLNAKKQDKSKPSFYNLRVVDDRDSGLAVVNQAKNTQANKMKPEEQRAQFDATQKNFYAHLVFMTNNSSSWKIVYGQNYRTLQSKATPTKK